MTKLEEAFGQKLELKLKAGVIRSYGYEQLKLRLAFKTFYTPDFVVLGRDRTITCYEVKGYWEDDARVKIKVAARAFPWMSFVAVTRKRKQWEYEEFEP